MAEQDHHHHAGRDDAEEGADLELLQQVLRLQQRRRALRQHRVGGAGAQDQDDEGAGDQDRSVVAAEAERPAAVRDRFGQRSSEDLQPVLQPQHIEAARG